jgi:two-component system, LytTR family, response regulator
MMEPLKVIIVDDEPLALDRLADLLERIDELELKGAFVSAAEAIPAIETLNPHLVFLDIEMPKIDGFDVVEVLARKGLSAGQAPLVCFVTAYPQFAIEAFDTGALDFLCKPVRLSRLEKTVERARLALERRDAENRLTELSDQLEELRRARSASQERSLWVQHRGEMIRVPVSGLDWVEAEGEYVRLHVGAKSFLLRNPIGSLAEDLSTDGFLRIHRSAVINLERLDAIHGTRSGLKVSLSIGVELPVGRKYRRSLLERVPGRGHQR